jgi:hypothetical protein
VSYGCSLGNSAFGYLPLTLKDGKLGEDLTGMMFIYALYKTIAPLIFEQSLA